MTCFSTDLQTTVLRIRPVLLVVLSSILMFTAGCSDSPTQSKPKPNQPDLLLSRLVVSVVPGGSESVTIHANEGDNSSDIYTVQNDDAGIALVTIEDSTLRVTGLTYGTAHLTVLNDKGGKCVLPVQVYDCHVLDVGELYVTLTDSFEFTTFHSYKPIPPDGFHALGAFFGAQIPFPDVDPNGRQAAVVVKAKPDNTSFIMVDSFYHSNYPYIAGWTPIAPEGYVALGSYMPGTWTAPGPGVCIRRDLTAVGKSSELLSNLHIVSPADYRLCFWKIGQPDVAPNAGTYLTAGTFICTPGTSTPQNHPAAHVLKLELPMLAAAPYQEFVPRLTGYETPPEKTPPKFAKAMLVPSSIINDLQHSGDIDWQVDNSPFYRLEREVYYKRLYHNHNQTSETQTNNVVIRSGITTTESERIWSETSISISVSAGICFKAFTGTVTGTVTRSFGYETQTSVSELQEKEVSTSINTPPGKAAALWQLYNRYVLYRHHGAELEPVSEWEFGIDSYVTDEYPD